MPAVICRGMDIRAGREDSSQAIRHRIENRLGNIRPLDDALDLFKPQRGFTNAHHANANVRRPDRNVKQCDFATRGRQHPTVR
ncbi:hypothetical protein RCCGE510_28966 (plasmid) [Rhizobium sp. CCGE 510]|nr:hypothetical protein RCCGE510_28966 [Rhizobium sp. CCGE 510]